MADAAELKDLAWENQWAGASGRAEPVLPWGPRRPRLEPAGIPTAQARADERPPDQLHGMGAHLTATEQDWRGLRASATSSRRARVRLWGARVMVAPANLTLPRPCARPDHPARSVL